MSYLVPANPVAGVSINGLGDSITAQAVFQPNMAPPATFPAWAASNGYAVGQCVANGGYGFYCSTAGTSAASGSGPAPSTTTITDGTAAGLGCPRIATRTAF